MRYFVFIGPDATVITPIEKLETNARLVFSVVLKYELSCLPLAGLQLPTAATLLFRYASRSNSILVLWQTPKLFSRFGNVCAHVMLTIGVV